MRISNEIRDIVYPYLVMYGPHEAKTGVKGIRSDAPEEVIEAFLTWYRSNNRYKSGRIMNKADPRLKQLIIDVSEDPTKDSMENEDYISLQCDSCMIA